MKTFTRLEILTNFFDLYKVIKHGMHVTHLGTLKEQRNFSRRIL